VSQSRIEVFRTMAEEQPTDPLIWYGLASEYVKLERWSEAADALKRVLLLNADYTAAYQMLGTALLNQGEQEQARRAWTDGIAAATRTGAWKARQHMEGLLAGTGDETSSGFCEE
jgi:predicted Zn-dependent protease